MSWRATTESQAERRTETSRSPDTGVTIWTAGQSELAGDLGLLRWRDATGRPIAAGTFAGAFVTPITNETDPSPWTSHGGEADQGTKVVLGPCAGEGFLTTFPMHPVQGESVASKVLEAAALAAETRQPTVASTRRPLPNEGLVQVLLKVARRVKNLDDDSVSSVPDHSVALFAGERVVPGPFPLIDAEPRWFRVGDRYVGLAAHTDTMETTGLVWWTDGTSVTSAAVVLLQSGC